MQLIRLQDTVRIERDLKQSLEYIYNRLALIPLLQNRLQKLQSVSQFSTINEKISHFKLQLTSLRAIQQQEKQRFDTFDQNRLVLIKELKNTNQNLLATAERVKLLQIQSLNSKTKFQRFDLRLNAFINQLQKNQQILTRTGNQLELVKSDIKWNIEKKLLVLKEDLQQIQIKLQGLKKQCQQNQARIKAVDESTGRIKWAGEMLAGRVADLQFIETQWPKKIALACEQASQKAIHKVSQSFMKQVIIINEYFRGLYDQLNKKINQLFQQPRIQNISEGSISTEHWQQLKRQKRTLERLGQQTQLQQQTLSTHRFNINSLQDRLIAMELNKLGLPLIIDQLVKESNQKLTTLKQSNLKQCSRIQKLQLDIIHRSKGLDCQPELQRLLAEVQRLTEYLKSSKQSKTPNQTVVVEVVREESTWRGQFNNFQKVAFGKINDIIKNQIYLGSRVSELQQRLEKGLSQADAAICRLYSLFGSVNKVQRSFSEVLRKKANKDQVESVRKQVCQGVRDLGLQLAEREQAREQSKLLQARPLVGNNQRRVSLQRKPCVRLNLRKLNEK